MNSLVLASLTGGRREVSGAADIVFEAEREGGGTDRREPRVDRAAVQAERAGGLRRGHFAERHRHLPAGRRQRGEKPADVAAQPEGHVRLGRFGRMQRGRLRQRVGEGQSLAPVARRRSARADPACRARPGAARSAPRGSRCGWRRHGRRRSRTRRGRDRNRGPRSMRSSRRSCAMSSASMPGTEPERASRSARIRMLRETREFASVRWWLRSMGVALVQGAGTEARVPGTGENSSERRSGVATTKKKPPKSVVVSAA